MFDIRASLRTTGAETVALIVGGVPVVYDAAKAQLACRERVAPLRPLADGTVHLQVLVDRASLEIYGNEGRVALPLGITFPEPDRRLELSARGGDALVSLLAVYPVRSIWQ